MSALKYVIRAKNEGQTKVLEVEINATFDDVKKKIQELFKGKQITPLVCASTKSNISNEEEFKAALEASKSEKSFVIEVGSQEVPKPAPAPAAKKEEPKKATPAAPAAKKEEPKKATPAASSKPVSTPAAKKEEPKKAAPAPAAAATPGSPAAGGNRCVKCSAKLPAGAKFCNKCGAPQNAAPAAAAAPAAPKEEPKKAAAAAAAGPDCCSACGKPLVGSSISLGTGENYHPECFVCSECGKGIRGPYMKIDGKFVCGNCFEEKHREVCAGCGKPIDGQYVGVGDKNYHPECFKCSKCGKQITGRFRYARDGALLCPSCN